MIGKYIQPLLFVLSPLTRCLLDAEGSVVLCLIKAAPPAIVVELQLALLHLAVLQ